MVRVHYVLWDEIPKCLDQVMQSTLGANTYGQTQSSVNCGDINTGGKGVVIVSNFNKVSISQRNAIDEVFCLGPLQRQGTNTPLIYVITSSWSWERVYVGK